MRTLSIAAGLWFALVMGGFVILGHEAYRSSPHVTIKNVFPAGSALPLDPNRLTLLLFVHPQCPCTEATFTDLDRILTETQGKLAVSIIFAVPPGMTATWEKGRLLTQAGNLKDVRVFHDFNAGEVKRFGVTTSGHVLLYSKQGHLLFSGGITASRGHAGDSPGETAIIHLTKAPLQSDTVEKPVFGCSLL
jgi:hypothetical protein